MHELASTADLEGAIAELRALEPRFAEVVQATGTPPLRRVEPGLSALLSIVNDQSISQHAASTVWSRTLAIIDAGDPRSVLDADAEELRSAGQSRNKIATFRAVAEAALDGRLGFETLSALDDEAVTAQLTAIRGIGPWSAQIYLLTCLGRSDVWPAADVALQIGAQRAFCLPDRPVGRRMIELAEPWRPWRSVAARLLWAYYRVGPAE